MKTRIMQNYVSRATQKLEDYKAAFDSMANNLPDWKSAAAAAYLGCVMRDRETSDKMVLNCLSKVHTNLSTYHGLPMPAGHKESA